MEKILVVDDNNAMREGIAITLKKEGYEVTQAEDGRTAQAKFSNQGPFSAVITDMKMPEMSGLELLSKIREISPDTPVVIITAYGSIETAVSAMKNGAKDFITKPFSPDEVIVKIRKILKESKSGGGTAESKESADSCCPTDTRVLKIVGKSPQMESIFKQAKVAGPTKASVLICGETGTGKELVATAIHNYSDRRNKPFIKVNSAALSEGVLESELFGHEKGSFTGAEVQKRGKFELADTGTLFLDEIGDMSAMTQSKILRVLQEGEFERVGGEKTVKVDVRIIAATNKDLKREIINKNFREDLYYRLKVFTIEIPPLHVRGDDIILIAEHFVDKYCEETGKKTAGIGDEAKAILLHYRWPGNVRELENVIQRAVIMCNDREITPEHLPTEISVKSDVKKSKSEIAKALFDMERDMLVKALESVNWVQKEAATLLGVSPRVLNYKIEKYGIKNDHWNRHK